MLAWQGRYATIQLPGGRFTIIEDINDWGDITGTYVCSAGAGHGFVANVCEIRSSAQLLPP